MMSTDKSAQAAMRDAIQNIAVGPDRGRDISAESAELVMKAILAGYIDDVQAAVFLIALRMKRESLGEFQGLYSALAASSSRVDAAVEELVCLADPFDGYARSVSMTPFIAPVLAACGVNVLMHGVESVGPKHGVTAHKVYHLAGMNCFQSATRAAQCLAAQGCSYLDQSIYASELYRLRPLRDKIIKRTALTTLERLLMPVRGTRKTHLVLGYVHKAYPEIYGRIASLAGYDSVLLLKGVEGGLAPGLNKPLRRFHLTDPLPADIESEKELVDLVSLGLTSSAAALANEDQEKPIEVCLEVGLDVLSGQPGIARDSLTLAAGHILFTHNKEFSLAQAVEKVQLCLDNGAAKARFEAMVSNG